MPTLDAAHAALVMIDPQNWTLGMPVAPHAADAVVGNAAILVRALRAAGGVVALTRRPFRLATPTC